MPIKIEKKKKPPTTKEKLFRKAIVLTEKPWKKKLSYRLRKAMGKKKGEPVASLQNVKKAKAGILKHIVLKKNNDGPKDDKDKMKLIDALARNLAGETVEMAAHLAGVSETQLNTFKQKMMREAGTEWHVFLENYFLQSATVSLEEFHKKKSSMTAKEAANVATAFAEEAISIRKARVSNFKGGSDEKKDHEVFLRALDIIERGSRQLPAPRKVTQAEVVDAEFTRENDPNK